MSETNGATPRCDGCRHFLRNGEGANQKYGVCRRYPKTVVAAGYQYWPQVYESHKDACGEHAPLPEGVKAATKEKVMPLTHGDRMPKKPAPDLNLKSPHKAR